MIEHDKQSARSLEQPAPAEPENVQAAAGRRRFLKGLGIGLPAVMTLRSGALLAGTSSKCAFNANHDPTPPDPAKFGPADNQWFRSDAIQPPKPYYEYSNSSNEVVIKSEPVDGNCYDPTTGLAPTTPPYSSTTCTDYSTKGNGPYYGLCYVDDDGNLQACQPNAVGYKPVSHSCAVLSFGL